MPRKASPPEFGQFRRGMATVTAFEELRVARPVRWVVGYVVGIYPAGKHCLVIDRTGQQVTILHHFPFYRPPDWPTKPAAALPQDEPADQTGGIMPADPPVDF